MAEPFIGQIMTTGFAFAPKNWALCNGQTLPVQQNQALFALLSNMYGGNGQTSFNLPDLRGRTPNGALPSADPAWQPQMMTQGQTVGSETVTLLAQNIPAHTHQLFATSAAAAETTPIASQRLATANQPIYNTPANMVGLAGGPLPPTPAQPHENMQPYAVVSMCIALTGIWPSRN